MAPPFLYKLFLSTIGSMPAQYDPEVDSWWGIVLTELGLSDPFREGNVSYLLMKFFGTVLFGLFLWALSLCNAYKNIRKERDNAREHSIKRAYTNSDLHNKLRDTENQLFYAIERLQASEKDMDDERREFRNTIQDLNNQHLVDQEEIRSLKQHVSNTECDRDEYGRRLRYATRDYRKLAQENQTLVNENEKLERENQQLARSLAEKDDTINELQARTNDLIAERVTAVSSAPIYIKPNDGELAERNERIHGLEQQNGTLTSETEVLRTALENLREEHGECNGHLQAQLAEKDEEMRGLRAEKETADDVFAVTVAGLRADLQKKKQEVEEANGALVANQASSADNLETLRGELQASQHAHAQCDETSASQNSRIGELMTARKQLEDTLRVKRDEIASLQGRVADLDNDREELQKTHANAQALEITQFRNANGALQESNDNLSQQLERARDEREALVREGQRVEEQNRTLLDLRTCSQSQTHSLQSRNDFLSQTVDDQQQRIHTLETNCPKCQELREALGAFVKDAEMSDDESRAELRREIAQELISQVPDHLRRQVRGEVERQLRQEFLSHYSDLLARKTKRIQEQDLLITEKDAKLAKANNDSTVNHAACERKEGYLQSTITRLKQDAKTLQGNCARLNSDAKTGREQLNREQTANEDLKRELETIKADQRRARNVNPLQGKLVACQRDVEKMKVDRDKARNNCSIYSKSLSDLRKKYEALQNERSSLDGDGLMEDGGSDGPLAVRNEQRMTTSAIDKRKIRTLDGEVARLSKELAELKARDNAREQVAGNQRRPARLPARLPARQPTDRSVLGGRAGKKRGHEESSDGEADDEGGDDRKKVKMHHLRADEAANFPFSCTITSDTSLRLNALDTTFNYLFRESQRTSEGDCSYFRFFWLVQKPSTRFNTSCCALREKEGGASNEQKWDYINLSDFRSSSCFTPLSYGILYLFLLISIAVYAVDLFTCANLLIFDRWSGQVKPAIPFHISRWIFTACIILSWILLVYRWMKAVRAIKSGVIAASYLDPLAVRVQSIRMGANGRGWRRFLVFAALTKGRKGNEYVALFTYFSFEAWLRICFAEGPRVAINAITLYSVMQADLVPTGQHSASNGHTPVVQFFVNVQILANKDKEQAAILFGMLFTLIIWVFSALSLALSVLFYVLYLWHHIRDGSLSRYCRRKIDTRLHKIVMKRVNKALAKDSNTRAKQGTKNPKFGQFQADVKIQPTLPVLDPAGTQEFATVSRQTTQIDTTSLDSCRPTDVVGPEPTLPNVFPDPRRPEPPSRSVTQSSARSNGSYESNAPLLNTAGEMGYGGNGHPSTRGAPSRMDSEGRTLHSARTPPNRSFTANSRSTESSFNSMSSTLGPPNRLNSDISGRNLPQPQPLKPMPRDMSFNTVGRRPTGPAGFGLPTQAFEMHPPVNRAMGPPSSGGYIAFNPHRHGSSSGAPVSVYSTPSSAVPSRNLTSPPRPPNDYFGSIDRPAQRSGTAPLPQATTFNTAPDDPYVENWHQPFARPVGPSRPATAMPGAGYGQRTPMPPRY